MKRRSLAFHQQHLEDAASLIRNDLNSAKARIAGSYLLPLVLLKRWNDEAQAEAGARQLVEQDRVRLREDTRRHVERLEQQLADAYERLQTEALLRRAAEAELERLREKDASRVT